MDARCLGVFQWLGLAFRGLLYGTFVVVSYPFLLLFRVHDRPPTVDDGVGCGYDDDDAGKNVDE